MALAVEGAASKTALTNVTTSSINITTSGTNRIVCIAIHNENPTTRRTVSTVTSSGLTFARRKQLNYDSSGSQKQNYELWWAYASAQLTAQAITVTLDGQCDDATFVVWAVSGVHSTRFSNPWDTQASLPVSNSNPTATAVSADLTFSTISTNTVGFALWAQGASNDSTSTPSGWSVVQANILNGGGANLSKQSVYSQVFSAAQSGTNVAVGSTRNWGMIADAISGDAAPSGFKYSNAVFMGG